LSAQLPGQVTRREVLQLGGMLVAAIVLSSCSDSGDGTGTEATDNDITLLRTASSLEALGVATYQAMLATGLVTDPGMMAALGVFQAHHVEHGRRMQAATTEAGGQAYVQPNPVLKQSVVDPTIPTLVDQTSVVAFASSFETILAETYAYLVGQLSLPSLRQAVMTVGGVEARHVAVLNRALGAPPISGALLPTADHVGGDAHV